ncbi:MAG: tetratricopeptide repeat protein [Candidatus Aminicenantes bacterium]|nr:tetratricopeptide repeat protein [Candidatus Aminicenantes bacterium]
MAEEKEKQKHDDYEKALNIYMQAIKSVQKGDYQKASEQLKSFMNKYSEEKELCARADIYLKICEGRLENTIDQPKDFEDYFQHAVYQLNSGNLEQALELAKNAEQKEPKQGKIHYLIASIYLKMDKLEEALESLKSAVQLDKYFKIIARNETDFEKLWQDKKFKLITKLT